MKKVFLCLLTVLITLGALPSGVLAEPEQAQSVEVIEISEASENSETPTVTETMYTKKKTYLYKAKKAATKGAVKVPQYSEVGVIEKGKSWTQAVYNDRTGYFKTSDLIAQLPTPTPVPSPTPEPKDIFISIPASEGVTQYVGKAGDVAVGVPEAISALVLNCYNLGEGYFSRVNSLVTAGIDEILAGSVPSSLSDYAECISAVAADISSGMVFELKGKALGAKKAKEVKIFTKDGGVIGASSLVQVEGGGYIFDFGTYTVGSSVDKATYYLQMTPTGAKNIRALYPKAETLTLLVPVKVSKMSSGGGGGGGGGGSSKQLPVARLILEGVRTEPSDPSAGETFDVVLTLRNTSEDMYLQNLQLSYTSEEDALRPVSGTNIEYIDRIDAGAIQEQRLKVTAKPDLENSSVKLDVAIDFEDKKLNAQTATLSALINVKQVQRIELDDPTLPTGEVLAGDTYEVSMGVFNMGKTMAYNVKVTAVPENKENVSAGTSYYIGNMDPGASKVAELSMVPLLEGEYKADLVVTYETVDGKPTELKKPLTFSVTPVDSMEYDNMDTSEWGNEPIEPEKPSAMAIMAMLPWQIYAGAGALIVLLIAMLGVSARKRRMRELEDDEMD